MTRLNCLHILFWILIPVQWVYAQEGRFLAERDTVIRDVIPRGAWDDDATFFDKKSLLIYDAYDSLLYQLEEEQRPLSGRFRLVEKPIKDYWATYKSAIAYYTYFKESVSISPGVFERNASFISCIFASQVVFGSATFLGTADFRFSRFQDSFDASSAIFQEGCDYSNVTFSGTSDFSDAYFRDASFENAVFVTDAKFTRAVFADILDFTKCRFQGSLDFGDVVLPDTIILRGASFGSLDLTRTTRDSLGAARGTPCVLDLRDTPMDQLKLRYDQFQVLVPDSISAVDFEELSNVYERLLTNFRERGYRSSFEKLEKEYLRFKYLQDPSNNKIEKLVGKVLNYTNQAWSDYGYEKSRIWYWTISFFCFFIFFNWLRLPSLAFTVYPVEAINSVLRKQKRLRAFRITMGRYPRINFFGFWLSIFYTGMIFFGLKVSMDRMNYSKLWSVAYLMFQYVLGLICLAYMANYIISSNLIGG